MERFCSLGVKVEFGNAEFTDEHSMKLNGRTYSARTRGIATGSSPSIVPIEGLDQTPYITNREIFSLDHLPASLIFLGAGPIAAEMAQAFARLGSKVAVVQDDSRRTRKAHRGADPRTPCRRPAQRMGQGGEAGSS